MLKDNIDTGDREQTIAGSLALAGVPAPRDATVAAKLRAAGAVILGKANLSEWASYRSSHASSGWAAAGADQHATDYTKFLDPDGLRGKRIGVMRALGGAEPNANRVLDEVIAAMKA